MFHFFKRRKKKVEVLDPILLRYEVIKEVAEFKRKLLLQMQDELNRDVGTKMSERRIVADAFVCMIERLRRDGKLSDQRAEWYYQQAAAYLGLDTAPGKLSYDKLKQAIRTRLYHFHDLYYRPVPFPDRHRRLSDYFGQGLPWKD